MVNTLDETLQEILANAGWTQDQTVVDFGAPRPPSINPPPRWTDDDDWSFAPPPLWFLVALFAVPLALGALVAGLGWKLGRRR